MPGPSRPLRPLLSVALPVAVAVVLVCLALVNIASVRTWRGEPEDGVLWALEGTNVVAQEVARGSAGERAGVLPRDVLVIIDGQEIKTPRDVELSAARAGDRRVLGYVVTRQSAEQPISLALQSMPLTQFGLYYSLAVVGILSIIIGAAVRLRRPTDQATLHFFWLSVAFSARLRFTRAASSIISTISSGGPTSSRGSRCRRSSCISPWCFRTGPSRG